MATPCRGLDPERLVGYVAGEMSESEQAEIKAHLSECSSCAVVVKQMERVVGSLREAREGYSDEESKIRAIRHISSHMEGNSSVAFNPQRDSPAVIPGMLATSPAEQAGRHRSLALLAGTRLAGYYLLECLGCGGWGCVFHAREANAEDEVAVKVLEPALSHEADLLERFRREAHAIAQIEHPNVPRVHGLHQAGGYHLLVTEYVRGENLRARIGRMGALGVPDALRVGKAVASALGAVHAVGIIHRDVKPQNILLSEEGEIKLTDFGLAKLSESALTCTGMVLGTFHYVSPEQLSDSKRVSSATDIYGLGCTLFCALAGRPPFQGSPNELTLSHLMRPAPDVREFAPEVSAPVADLVADMLVKDPDKRIRTASELLGRIESIEKC
jgi:hypothetical protein